MQLSQRDQAAGTQEIPSKEFVARMFRKPGVQHLVDLGGRRCSQRAASRGSTTAPTSWKLPCATPRSTSHASSPPTQMPSRGRRQRREELFADYHCPHQQVAVAGQYMVNAMSLIPKGCAPPARRRCCPDREERASCARQCTDGGHVPGSRRCSCRGSPGGDDPGLFFDELSESAGAIGSLRGSEKVVRTPKFAEHRGDANTLPVRRPSRSSTGGRRALCNAGGGTLQAAKPRGNGASASIRGVVGGRHVAHLAHRRRRPFRKSFFDRFGIRDHPHVLRWRYRAAHARRRRTSADVIGFPAVRVA